MGLRMKNFNILGFTEKFFLGGGGVHEKPIYMGEMSKGGAETVFTFKGGGFSKKGGDGVFLGGGGLIPHCTL